MSDIKYVSASKLKSYRNCPFRQKNEKFQENEAMRFGTAVHAGIAEWLKGNDFLSGYSKEALAKGLPPEMQSRAVQCFERVRDSEKLKINRDNIITIESEDGDVTMFGKRYFEVPMGSSWGIRGAMDLVDIVDDKILRIPDWKTGYGEEIDDLQLACYALVAYKKYPGFEIYEPGFFYLDKGVWVSTRWDKNSLVGAFEAVENLALAFINEREWPQKTNKYCSYCTLKDGCDAYKKMLVQMPDKPSWDIEPTLQNFPEICERLRKIESVKKAAESIFETLKSRRETVLRANGDQITAGNHVVKGIERASSWSIDVGSVFLEVEKIIGRAPFEILKLDSGSFDDLVKSQTDRSTKIALNKIKKQFTKIVGKTYKVTSVIAGEPAKEEGEDETIEAKPETIAAKIETEPAKAETIPAETETPAIQDAEIVREPPAPELTPVPAPKTRGMWLICVCCGFMTGPDSGILKTEPCPACEKPHDMAWTSMDTKEKAEFNQYAIIKRIEEKEKLGQQLAAIVEVVQQ